MRRRQPPRRGRPCGSPRPPTFDAALDELIARVRRSHPTSASASVRIVRQLLRAAAQRRAVRPVPVGRRRPTRVSSRRAASTLPQSEFTYAHRPPRPLGAGRVAARRRAQRPAGADADPSIAHVAIANPSTRRTAARPRRRCSRPACTIAVKPKLVLGENVAQAMQFVAERRRRRGRRRALAGAGADRRRARALFDRAARHVSAPGAGRRDSERRRVDRDAALAFARSCSSADGRAILKRYGFFAAGPLTWTGPRSGSASAWPRPPWLMLLVVGMPIAYWIASRAGAGSFSSRRSSRCRWCCRRPCSASTCWWRSARGARSAAAYQRFTGHGLPFTFEGLLIASVIYSLPFAVQPLAAAFAPVDRRLIEASWSLGASRLARSCASCCRSRSRGVVTGIVLSFAHTLGEFGVVLMVGGNIRASRAPSRSRSTTACRRSTTRGVAHVAAAAGVLVRHPVDHLLAAAVDVGRMADVADASTSTQRFASGFVDRAPTSTSSCAPARMLVLFGPSGAGKTTILRAIAGLEPPDRPRPDWATRSGATRARRRWVEPPQRRIGLVFQEPTLFPHLTVRRQHRYGVSHQADPGAPPGQTARSWKSLGIDAISEIAIPRQLSGGEAQRVALARALAPTRGCCCSTSRSPRSTRRRGAAAPRRLRVLHPQRHIPRSWSRTIAPRRSPMGDRGRGHRRTRAPGRPGAATCSAARPTPRSRASLGIEVGPAGASSPGTDRGLIESAVGDVSCCTSPNARRSPTGSATCYACIRAEDVTLETRARRRAPARAIISPPASSRIASGGPDRARDAGLRVSARCARSRVSARRAGARARRAGHGGDQGDVDPPRAGAESCRLPPSYVLRQRLAARLLAERQQQQADQERDRRERDRRADACGSARRPRRRGT